MTDTYPPDAPTDVKIAEELRLIRCVLERLLQKYPEFVDYQMEKFGPGYVTEEE